MSDKINLKFIQGDPYRSAVVLEKNGDSNFDAIILMDNSFGYEDKNKDIQMLCNLLKVAKKGCVIILETENRDWRLQNFEPITLFESNKTRIHATWKFHFETSVSEGSFKFYKKRSNKTNHMMLNLKLQMLMRLYSLHELIEVIQLSGWNYKESYDDIVSLKRFANSSMSIFSVSVS